MTMNKIKNATVFVILMATSAITVAAQKPSLAKVGSEGYTSQADGFVIAVPPKCVVVSETADGRHYICDVQEGRISITFSRRDPAVNTERQLAAYLSGFKGTLMKSPDVKLTGETSTRMGSYRGATYRLLLGTDKVTMLVLASGRTTCTVSTRAFSMVENSAELIETAVKSFAFARPKE